MEEAQRARPERVPSTGVEDTMGILQVAGVVVASGVAASAQPAQALVADAPTAGEHTAYDATALPVAIPAGASVRATIVAAKTVQIRVIRLGETTTSTIVWDDSAPRFAPAGASQADSRRRSASQLRALAPGFVQAMQARSSVGDTPGSRFDSAQGAWVACVWLDAGGHALDLPMPDEAIAASALDISAPGDVVGAAISRTGDAPQQSHAVLWRDGSWRWLDADERTTGAAMGVSAAGDVVGWIHAPSESAPSAVLWPNGNAPALELTAFTNLPANVRLVEAHDIDAAGFIVALGNNTRTGERRLWLLAPREAVLDRTGDGAIDARDALRALREIRESDSLARWLQRFLAATGTL